MARREERVYWAYVSDEQRRQPGCLARELCESSRFQGTSAMDAAPLLFEVARHVHDLRFDVVLIGNAAAALQGAPVTTVDFDFMFRKTPTNLRKLKDLARGLGATILRPYYPA